MTGQDTQFIESLIEKTNGRFFAVEFIKKDGTLRKLVGRVAVRKGVTGEGMKYDPRPRGLKTVFDIQKDSWRMVNLTTVQSLRCGEIQYAV